MGENRLRQSREERRQLVVSRCLRTTADRLRRNLDCAVIRHLHTILETQGLPAVDTVKGVFTEGKPIYPGAGFDEKTHIQIVVRNQLCIKGVLPSITRLDPLLGPLHRYWGPYEKFVLVSAVMQRPSIRQRRQGCSARLRQPGTAYRVD